MSKTDRGMRLVNPDSAPGVESSFKTSNVRTRNDVVIVGSGIAGLMAAEAAAVSGRKVSVLCRNRALLEDTLPAPGLLGEDGHGKDLLACMESLLARLKAMQGIRFVRNVTSCRVTGELGGFDLQLVKNSRKTKLRSGAIILAEKPGNPNHDVSEPVPVVDAEAVVEDLVAGRVPVSVAVMLDREGPSGRLATRKALNLCLLLSHEHGVRTHIFCESMRVASFGVEGLYRRARQAGTVVSRLDSAPRMSVQNGKAQLTWSDEILGEELSGEFARVVVVDDAVSRPASRILVDIPRLRPGDVFQYDNVWLLPVETNIPGIMAVGEARGRGDVKMFSEDALAAVARLDDALPGKSVSVEKDSPSVDESLCVLCLTCVRICPHGAMGIDEGKGVAVASKLTCRRCGACVSACPAQAITLPRYTDESMVLPEDDRGKTVVFACENSAIAAMERDGVVAAGLPYDETSVIRVPCAGRVHPAQVLSCLEKGATKVVVAGCHPESCRYLTGASHAKRRVERLRAYIEQAGQDPDRVVFKGIASVEPANLLNTLNGKAI